MLLKRKNIIICSMILLLFVIGYTYNAFTTSKFMDNNYSIDLNKTLNEDFGAIPSADKTAITTTAKENGNNGVSIVKDDKQQAVPTTSASFFSEYRLEREKNRSKEVDMWENIINNPASEKTFKSMAQQELVKIVALTEKEMIIENLIVSRGFNDALVFLTDDAATVIVDAKELTQANVAQIQDILVRKTKLDPTKIKIMKKN